MDFAVSQLPGWHTTIFPPYFVAGAIFSGFAMVITLMVICRKAFGLEQIITMRHFDYMAKVILVTGCMVGYAYAIEFFIAWYSGNPYEVYVFVNRATGPYAWAYWTMVSCNVLVPQLFWFKKVRRSLAGPVRDLDLRQHRDVVRALRDHRDLAAPRLPAVVLGLLPPDDLGLRQPDRRLRPLLHALLPVRALRADGGDRRGEDGAARRPTRTTARPRGRGAPAPVPALPGGASFGAARRVRDPGGALPRVRVGARRRLLALGRAHAVPGARPRPRDGAAGARSCPGSCSCWRWAAPRGGFALQTWVHSIAYPR